MATTPAEKPSPVPPIETVEQQFHRLEAEWRKATEYHSNPSIIMGHPTMRAIIAMGPEVVPIILRELQAGGDWQLGWALHEITSENAAPPLIEGGFAKWDAREQVQAWLRWGRGKGLV